jgi:hypothetical protein
LIIARLFTTNFTFEAAGETKEQARAVLISGLEAHGREYRAEPSWYLPYLGKGDEEVQYSTLEPGTCLRDRMTLVKPWSQVPLTAPKPRPGQSDDNAIAEDETANGCR